MLGNRAAQRREMLAPHSIPRLIAMAVKERAGADEVGEQDRDERLLHPRHSIIASRGADVTSAGDCELACSPRGMMMEARVRRIIPTFGPSLYGRTTTRDDLLDGLHRPADRQA